MGSNLEHAGKTENRDGRRWGGVGGGFETFQGRHVRSFIQIKTSDVYRHVCMYTYQRRRFEREKERARGIDNAHTHIRTHKPTFSTICSYNMHSIQICQ